MSPQLDARERLGPWPRVLLAAWAVMLVAVLAVARRLEPDPRGFGTHEQLGLSPCAFRATTGRPSLRARRPEADESFLHRLICVAVAAGQHDKLT